MDFNSFIEKLWLNYKNLNPQVGEIHNLLNDEIINDHIALRTWSSKDSGLDATAKIFEAYGFEIKGDYFFKEKKLKAIHLEHKDHYLKIFISEIQLDSFSEDLKNVFKSIHYPSTSDAWIENKNWTPSHKTYLKLLKESEYAAWLYAFGFMANHFTISINHLNNYSEVRNLNHFIELNGYKLNSSGGKIKGSPETRLEQSSTLASKVEVSFEEDIYEIPCCYYEFAKRYDGFNGFVTSSADKIFESTDQD